MSLIPLWFLTLHLWLQLGVKQGLTISKSRLFQSFRRDTLIGLEKCFIFNLQCTLFFFFFFNASDLTQGKAS